MSQQALEQLQQHRMDCAVKKREERLYTTILTCLGVGSVLVSVILIILSQGFTDNKGTGIGIIGLVLLMMGEAWTQKNSKNLEKAEEALEKIKKIPY